LAALFYLVMDERGMCFLRRADNEDHWSMSASQGELHAGSPHENPFVMQAYGQDDEPCVLAEGEALPIPPHLPFSRTAILVAAFLTQRLRGHGCRRWGFVATFLSQ
jgi:hypothetical protein